MPAPTGRHSHLAEMSTDQLGVAVSGLNRAREQYEQLSGACAVLAGLVCLEAKNKLGHGNYLPWLKQHLGKSRETAAQYVAIAREFSKCHPRATFEQMTLALMDGAQTMAGEALDLTHPTVSAVAKWTDGRTFYELRETFARNRGGRQEKAAAGEKLTPDEERQIFLDSCREDFTACFTRLDALLRNGHWKAETIVDAELESAVAAAELFTKQATKWLKTPQRDRSVLSMEEEA